MALGFAHTHTFMHESDFKKPQIRCFGWRAPGLKIFIIILLVHEYEMLRHFKGVQRDLVTVAMP